MTTAASRPNGTETALWKSADSSNILIRRLPPRLTPTEPLTSEQSRMAEGLEALAQRLTRQQFRAARLAACDNLAGPFRVAFMTDGGTPNAIFHVRLDESSSNQPLPDYEFVSVELPIALSQELQGKSNARGLKVGIPLDLPFVQWLVRSRVFEGQGRKPGMIVTVGGECARLVDPRR